jgi:hypothetical protein
MRNHDLGGTMLCLSWQRLHHRGTKGSGVNTRFSDMVRLYISALLIIANLGVYSVEVSGGLPGRTRSGR